MKMSRALSCAELPRNEGAKPPRMTLKNYQSLPDRLLMSEWKAMRILELGLPSKSQLR
jgi:TfoX/Sxy family transcriptional regulator of competence genes